MIEIPTSIKVKPKVSAFPIGGLLTSIMFSACCWRYLCWTRWSPVSIGTCSGPSLTRDTPSWLKPRHPSGQNLKLKPNQEWESKLHQHLSIMLNKLIKIRHKKLILLTMLTHKNEGIFEILKLKNQSFARHHLLTNNQSSDSKKYRESTWGTKSLRQKKTYEICLYYILFNI